jgi:hypothetical protein
MAEVVGSLSLLIPGLTSSSGCCRVDADQVRRCSSRQSVGFVWCFLGPAVAAQAHDVRVWCCRCCCWPSGCWWCSG